MRRDYPNLCKPIRIGNLTLRKAPIGDERRPGEREEWLRRKQAVAE